MNVVNGLNKGNNIPVAVDDSGRVCIGLGQQPPYASQEFESGAQVKVGAGKFVAVLVHNRSGSDVFVQLHDVAAEPDNDQIPKLFAPVKAGTSEIVEFPWPCVNGIYICASSDAGTKVAAGSDFWFNVHFD